MNSPKRPPEEKKQPEQQLREAAGKRVAGAPLGEQPGHRTDALLLELQVYRIELEMQNEALRQAQIALEDSRDHYADLYELAPVPYLTLTEKGLIAEVNLAGAALLGIDRSKLLQMRFARFLSPDAADSWHRYFSKALKQEGRLECELALQCKTGMRIDVQLSSRRKVGADGASALHMVLNDITERKAAETESRIAAIAFNSMEAMIVTDARRVILRVNPAFVEATGYTAEEVIGQMPRLFSSDRHDADFYHAIWETVGRTGNWSGEMWGHRKNGEEYPMMVTVSAVLDGDGEASHYVLTHHDITERRKSEERIENLAYLDPLTHLPNRTLLLDRLNQAMTASHRDMTVGAALFIDLDHFKTLNDTLGHDKGDLLLQQVAQRLVGCIREGDTVARLGGDEFVVVLGGMSGVLEDAAIQTRGVAEKILAALGETYQLGEVKHHSTASIGATLFQGHETSTDDLLKQADLAMYKAKNIGRNSICFYDAAMQSVILEHAALGADLRNALEQGQFVLHYQAQVVSGEAVTGAEVLLRWQHPRRGLVPPGDFIPLAEETGLILPLGHWVLETACTRLAIWATRTEMAHLTLAVNVSARQFQHDDYVDQVLAVLKSSGANPRRLKLELAESLLVADIDDVVEKMLALKAVGIGFSLGDFGTGFSSLSCLKRLPLDELKIDQSFVRDVLTDSANASIPETIIALAENLGLHVIAEGVETEAQRDFLASSGCDAYQGYFFSRPLPLEGFEAFMKPV